VAAAWRSRTLTTRSTGSSTAGALSFSSRTWKWTQEAFCPIQTKWFSRRTQHSIERAREGFLYLIERALSWLFILSALSQDRPDFIVFYSKIFTKLARVFLIQHQDPLGLLMASSSDAWTTTFSRGFLSH
jgi:hypothetical protein